MVRSLRVELGTEHGTVHRVATQLGYEVEPVQLWVKQDDIDEGVVTSGGASTWRVDPGSILAAGGQVDHLPEATLVVALLGCPDSAGDRATVLSGLAAVSAPRSVSGATSVPASVTAQVGANGRNTPLFATGHSDRPPVTGSGHR